MEKDIADILYELQNVRGFLFIALGLMLVVTFSAVVAAIASILAIKLFSELIKASKANNLLVHSDIEDLLSQGKAEDALEEIEHRLKTHPNDIEATVLKGRAYYKLEKYHEAKRAFDDAYDLNPNSDVTVELWQRRIKEKLDESTPKIVN